MRSRILAGALAWLVGGVIATAAVAAPVARPAAASSEAAAIAAPLVKVHGCHFDLGPGMAPDRQHGPHYHDRSCAVVRVGPRGGAYDPPPPPPPRRYRERYDAPPPAYRGPPPGYGHGYGYRPPRGPICQERCRYTGPIKRCRIVCQ